MVCLVSLQCPYLGIFLLLEGLLPFNAVLSLRYVPVVQGIRVVLILVL